MNVNVPMQTAQNAKKLRYVTCAKYAKLPKFAKPSLPKQSYHTKPNKQNMPNQTYQTKPYQTKPSQPNLPSQIYKMTNQQGFISYYFEYCDHWIYNVR